MTDEQKQSEAEEATPQVEEAPSEAAEVERLQALVVELKNQLARTQADWENYKRRVAREKEDLQAFANQRLVLGFLPVLDNLDRALSTAPAAGDEKLRQGVEMTARSFRDSLAKEGVTEIEAAPGQSFDPILHEAVMTVENPEYEEDQIVLEFQKGYRLGDRVIRPSRVQVNKLA
ncbi:MAG TPA: nucleotide exchange factor GrpE [Symbiobacteriaceae bacterium]|nr:nucleotide exchange factor GrpE [Symbiobacteriaceae bacterium]